jgi:hypothetical protein
MQRRGSPLTDQAVHLRDVRAVTVVVVDVYPGQKGHSVVLREVQFFERKV